MNKETAGSDYNHRWFERHRISENHSIIGIKLSISRGTGYINSVSFVLWSDKPATEEEREVMMKKTTDFNKCRQFVYFINFAIPFCLLVFTIIALFLGIPEYTDITFVSLGIIGRFGVVGFSLSPITLLRFEVQVPLHPVNLIFHCLCILVMILYSSATDLNSTLGFLMTISVIFTMLGNVHIGFFLFEFCSYLCSLC